MPRKPGVPYGLPGYEYRPTTGRYHNLKTGRFVKRETIVELLIDVTHTGSERLAGLGSAAGRGELTPRQFYEMMEREVKHLYNANSAVARGGWDRLSLPDLGRNGKLLQEEYKRLVQFSKELADGKLTEAQARARAALYCESAFGRYWEIETQQQKARGATQEKLQTMGDDRVCQPICIPASNEGWKPIGTWIIPLHAGCRCMLLFRGGNAS